MVFDIATNLLVAFLGPGEIKQKKEFLTEKKKQNESVRDSQTKKITPNSNATFRKENEIIDDVPVIDSIHSRPT
jgi:hypothetical protein